MSYPVNYCQSGTVLSTNIEVQKRKSEYYKPILHHKQELQVFSVKNINEMEKKDNNELISMH